MADIKDNVKIKKIDTALAGEFNKLKLKLVSYLSIAEVEREYLENEAVKAKDSVSSAMTSSNIDDLRNSIDKFKDIDDAMKKFKDSHSKMYAAAKKILTLPDENKEMLVQNGRVLSSGEIISTKDMDEAFEVSQNSLGDVLSSVDRDEIKQAVEKTMTSSKSENENSAEADYISNKVNSDNLEDVVRLVKEQAIEEMNKPKTEDDVAEKDEHKLTMEDMDDIFAKARGEAKEEPVVEEPLPSPSEAKPDTPIFSDDESIFNFSPFYVPVDDLNRIQNLDNIKLSYTTQNDGFTVYTDDKHTFSVQMLNFSDGALQNLGIELVDGWLPESENEVVISSQLVKNENLNLAIGSRITLPIPGEENKTKDYSLVGIVNITNQQIEPMTSATASNKCYTFISRIDNNNLSGNYDIYLRFSNLAKRIDTIVNILELDENTYKKAQAKTISETEENILENESNKYECVSNNNLIMMELGDDYDQTSQMLYTVAIVVLIIIILISAYCIKNSFNISITEKVKQYGMLASIGTTPKQIRRNVLYEALILGIIGIPIGILLGIGSIYLLLQFIQNKLTDEIFGMKFIFSTNIIAIAFAIVFSALTVYLSARKSANSLTCLSSNCLQISNLRSSSTVNLMSSTDFQD